MNVLGLTGYAGAGKSTAANYLVERHGFTRVSFAAPLKKMLRTLDPIIGRNHWGANPSRAMKLSDLFNAGYDENWIKASTYGPEYRRLLQVLGTDCVRAVQEDFWVRAAEAQMTDPEGRYVFDDCRFPNEAEFIEGLNPNGLWNVTRDGYTITKGGHISEVHAGNMGETIFLFNDCDVEDLHDQIDAAVDMMNRFGGVKA